MHVLIADKFSDTGIQTIRNAGHTVTSDPTLQAEALLEALREKAPHVLVVRSTSVTASMMDACPSLELIVRAGAGYDTIDVEAASARGIFLANCPGKNAVAVAELAFGLLLALDRFIPDNVQMARTGQWNKQGFSKAEGVKGKTLGLIGLGNIGKAMVKRAHAFGMRVAAWSRSLTDERAARLGIMRMESPVAVAEVADVLSVHVAANPDTHHLINAEVLNALRPGGLLLNTSRGSVVDEQALKQAMDNRGIRAGLDVFQGEPAHKAGPFEHPLAGHPNVYLTHHIGASTAQATAAIGAEAVRVILTFAETGEVPNCVNMADHTAATYLLTVRHLDKVGVLATVLDEMRKASWNIQEMENLVFAGEKAACARIRFAGTMHEPTLTTIRSNPDVIAVSVLPLTD